MEESAGSGPSARSTVNLRIKVNSPAENNTDLAMDITMPLSSKVEDLKGQIRDQMASKPSKQQQRIIFRGHVLQDHQTLGDAFGTAVPDDDNPLVIHMIVRPSPTDRFQSASAPVTRIPTPTRTIPGPQNQQPPYNHPHYNHPPGYHPHPSQNNRPNPPPPPPLPQQMPQPPFMIGQPPPMGFPQGPIGAPGFQPIQFYGQPGPAPGPALGFPIPPPFFNPAQAQQLLAVQQAQIQRIHNQIMQQHQAAHNAAVQANNPGLRGNVNNRPVPSVQEPAPTSRNAEAGAGDADANVNSTAAPQQPLSPLANQAPSIDAEAARRISFQGPVQSNAAASASQPTLRVPSPEASANARSSSAPSRSTNETGVPGQAVPLYSTLPTSSQPPQLSQFPSAMSFTTSFAPGVITGTRITARVWSSMPGGSSQSTTPTGQQYYLLTGPDGPNAILLGPQTSASSNMPPFNQQFPLPPPLPLPNPQVFAALMQNPTVPSNNETIIRAQRVQRSIFWHFIAYIAGIELVPPPGQPALTGNDIAERIRRRIGHFWLLVRLMIGVALFTGGTDWKRNFVIYAIATAIFVWQTGILNAYVGPILRMFNPDQQQQQRNANNANANAANANVNNNPVANANPNQPPNVQEAAARLVRRDNEQRVERIRGYFDSFQRGIWIFMASLIPGLGERVGEARAARQREAQARQIAADAAAAALAAANAANQNEGEQQGDGNEQQQQQDGGNNQGGAGGGAEEVVQNDALIPELEHEAARVPIHI